MGQSRRSLLLGLPAVVLLASVPDALAGPRVSKVGRAKPKPKAKPKSKVKPRVLTKGKPVAKVDAKTLRRGRKHVLRPRNIRRVTSDTGVSARYRKVSRVGKIKLTHTPRLDIDKFGPAIHAQLAGSVTGYAWQLRKNGVPVHTGQWQWAQTASDAGQGWSLDTRMHIASVSKLLTAMATVHALAARNRTVDETIKEYLPAYWAKGSNISQLTFRHLLTHRSGFRGGGSASDFGFMKGKVAAGVGSSTFGMYGYHNMNFGLCRILIPVLFGWINRTDEHGSATDHIWDYRTIIRFREYCQTNVFSPAGVSNVGFKPTGTRALAYRYPPGSGKGWNSGDLATVSGGAGFRLSVNELLSVMGTFRRGGSIMSASNAQTLLDSALGIDQFIESDLGRLYNKNGRWANDSRTEQAVAYFMPDGMEMVLFVNSPIQSGKSLRGLVSDAFIANVK